jgi:subtilisin family serine protease
MKHILSRTGFAITLLALLGLIVVGSTSIYAQQMPSNSSDVSSIPLSLATLQRQAQERGTVRVIVGLATPTQPEGLLTPSRATAQRATIAKAQDTLLNRLLAHQPTVNARYETIPALGLTVDEAGLQALANDPDVERVAEDKLNKPLLDKSTVLIGADKVWESGFTGKGQAVAILDTGVDKTHPFLKDKVIAEGCFSTTDANQGTTSVCPEGVSESTAPGSGIDCGSVTGCDHGTHVAGIAAGKGDSFSGVAKEANIVAVQVFTRFGEGDSSAISAYDSDIIKGLEYVYQLSQSMPIASANMSLGNGSYEKSCDTEGSGVFFHQIVENLRGQEVAVIAASGNEHYLNTISSPACVSNIISVGSVDEDDTVSSLSNSADILDLLAPGGLINSSVPGGEFKSWDGTSMAAPQVAGAWALLLEAAPQTSVQEMLTVLKNTGTLVKDDRTGSDGTVTNRVKPRIQLDKALSQFDQTLTPKSQEQFAKVGATIAYSLTLYNSNATSDTFRLAMQDYTWPTSMTISAYQDIYSDDTSVTLAPNGKEKVTITVTVPLTATSGHSDTVKVTAQPSSDTTKESQATITTYAYKQGDQEVAIGPASSSKQAMTYAQPITYSLTVTNTGEVRDAYTLKLTGNKWKTSIPLSVKDLDPQQSAEITLIVLVPPSGISDGESDTATVTVASKTDPTKTAKATVQTTFMPVRAFMWGISSSVLTATAKSSVAAANYLWNVGSTIDQAKITIEATWPTTITSEAYPGSVYDKEVTTPPMFPMWTRPVSYPVNIAVTPPADAKDGESDTATIRAASLNNPDRFVDYTITTVVSATDITPPPPTESPIEDNLASEDPDTVKLDVGGKMTPIGSKAKYRLTLTNTGTQAETFTVSGYGNQWPTSVTAATTATATLANVTPYDVTLNKDESSAFDIAVDVPSTAAVGSTDTVTMTVAVKNSTSGKQAELPITTTADSIYLYLPLISQ